MNKQTNNKQNFEIFDVRKQKGNFLPAILKKADKIEIGNGLCIIQGFEPIPLYSAMAEKGFEHETDKISETEYRVYFRKTAEGENIPEGGGMPFRPTAIVNFNTIDPKLAHNVVNFWNYIWGQENPAIDMKTRLLLSLANGVGAGRMRQAVREFIKGYSIGITTAEFDELFALFAWNQGVGFFASEIGPSALFGAYKMVKTLEEKGENHSDIVAKLMNKYGENNPQVGTMYKKANNDYK